MYVYIYIYTYIYMYIYYLNIYPVKLCLVPRRDMSCLAFQCS